MPPGAEPRIGVADCLAAIERHTRGLAAAAEGNLERRIEHCPDWSMADLVRHLTGVHAFWNRLATDRPTVQPSERPDVSAIPEAELVPALLTGMETLVATLGAADQSAACWTWGQEENVWFITRHQVQEAAVHHWDAVNASGGSGWSMDPLMAMDAVDEFLTHSVANPRWPMPDADPIGGTIWFCACETPLGQAPGWDITDGAIPGTVSAPVNWGPDTGEIDGPVNGAHVDPSYLLLWLYRRIPDLDFYDPTEADRAMIDRFRALTFTD